MKLSKHAKERWEERFPTLNPQYEWANTKRVGRKLIKRVKKQCPNHVVSKSYEGYYYRISNNGVIFVTTPPELIVTVFPLDSIKDQEE